jgi:hypothetical protein
MRTKALLIASAALAAGVVTSQAQVYSQNIVGYINAPAPVSYSVQSVQLDISGGNSLTNIIQNPVGNLDGSGVYVWNGTTYTTYILDSTLGGVADATDSHAVPSPTLSAGTPFLFNNQGGVAITNTFVGSVHFSSGTYPGTTTNQISSAILTFTASVLPIGGGVSTVLQFTNSAGALDGNYILIPVISGGVQTGFSQVTFDSGFSTGFGDVSDSFQVPEPVIPVGGGFFFGNQSVAPYTWVQSLGQ